MQYKCELRFIYFRPTIGEYKCKLSYDDQDDLVFNLDNRHLVFYRVMFQYLFSMVQTGSPLVSMHRHFSTTNAMMSNVEIIPFPMLRKAWNAFVRLLDIDYSNAFVCQDCGMNPDIIICDGTDVGMKKDLIPDISASEQNNIKHILNQLKTANILTELQHAEGSYSSWPERNRAKE